MLALKLTILTDFSTQKFSKIQRILGALKTQAFGALKIFDFQKHEKRSFRKL